MRRWTCWPRPRPRPTRRRGTSRRPRGRGRPRDRRGFPAPDPRGLRKGWGKDPVLHSRPCPRTSSSSNRLPRHAPSSAISVADYRVLASYGHVRDLPENPGKGKFGVDVDHDFEPEYVISDDRRKQVADIEKAAKGSDQVYLATDLDREGEAIAWHVAEAAHVPPEKTQRVTFNEITESAIREAFANPRQIDMDLVDAQQTRRIVDRLVGYTLSPLLGQEGPARPVGRPRAVRRRPAGRRARARDPRLHRPRVLDDPGHPRDRRRRDLRRRARADRRQCHRDPGRGDVRRACRSHPRAHAGRHQGRDADTEAVAGGAVHDLDAAAGGEPQARASARSGRCRSPSGCTRASRPARVRSG